MNLTFEPETYTRRNSVVFRKTAERYGGLSNMAPGFPVEVNGIRIRTVEALYQACRFPHRPNVQRIIIQEHSPMTAKMRGKPHRKETRPDWDRVRVDIMRWCLLVKLAQNWQKFSALLLATEDRPIVEESHKDDFWGAEPADNEKLFGRNVLGRLLMELREELPRPNGERLRRIEPPRIPQFLLYGRPIVPVEANEHIAAQDAKLFGMPAGVGTQQSRMTYLQSDNYSRSSQQKPEESISTQEIELNIESSSSVIPKECKRLAEVDFPIAIVSKHAAQENSVRRGHPKTLHLWWARRPLAACRSMLLALLLPDPCDQHCPEEFKREARELLKRLARGIGPKESDLRQALLRFIGDFASWDLSADTTYLEIGRGLVKSAHGGMPLVVDPFAGGGSIPIEALRLNCDAFASDLNPIAGLILKALLEDIPRDGYKLADELRRAGEEIKLKIEKELAQFYPLDPNGARPVAYMWARTVQCESTGCGLEIPLIRSFWLCNKARRKRALRYKIASRHSSPSLELEIFEPIRDSEVPSGTVSQAKAICPRCNAVLPPERVRVQLGMQHGGADVDFNSAGVRVGGARLLAVVSLSQDGLERNYRPPTDRDYTAVWRATKYIASQEKIHLPNRLSLIPDESIVQEKVSRNSPFRMHLYGCTKFRDLFNCRQKAALLLIQQQIRDASVAASVKVTLTLGTGKLLRHWNAFTKWHRGSETVAGSFALQAISMAWDYPEMSPFCDYAGSLKESLDNLPEVVDQLKSAISRVGQVEIADAAQGVLPDASSSCWFTDPPYYDAIPYADLSDFFYVWHKRVLSVSGLMRNPFEASSPLTPKAQEIVQDDNRQANGRPKNRAFFEEKMSTAFAQGRRVLMPNGIGCIVFAHKTTEGWEALMQGAIRGGWTITSSWPIATERRARLRARESAALATSVHLVCRPRTEDRIGDWEDVIRELPKRIGDWMERLSSEGIRGADLVFACIGPAMEVYSRYSRVEDAEGREIPLGGDPTMAEPYKRGFLAYVWETVGRTALQQVLGTAEARARNGVAGALEEDARLTALFLWTLQATDSEAVKTKGDEVDENDEPDDAEEGGGKTAKKKGFTLIYDVARRFAQPLGIHLDQWEGRIIETEKGIVRLLPVPERAEQLFGEDGASAVADRIEANPTGPLQMGLFSAEAPAIKGRGRGKKLKGIRAAEVSDEKLTSRQEATTLDRVHAAMLLQTSGRTNTLRALLKAEQERGPDFLRLANALSALYPKESEEKRLLDAMLLAVPR